jgi:hypothetical protein
MKKTLFLILILGISNSCVYYYGFKPIYLYRKIGITKKPITLCDWDKFIVGDSTLYGKYLIISKSGIVHKYNFNAGLNKKNGRINVSKIKFWYFKNTHTAKIIKDSLDFYDLVFQLREKNTDSLILEYRNQRF